MTKDEQFDGLRRVRPRELCQPPEHLDHGQVQHPHHHDEIMAEIDESPAHTACDGYWHRTGTRPQTAATAPITASGNPNTCEIFGPLAESSSATVPASSTSSTPPAARTGRRAPQKRPATGREQAEREAAYQHARQTIGPPRLFRMGPDGTMQEVSFDAL